MFTWHGALSTKQRQIFPFNITEKLMLKYINQAQEYVSLLVQLYHLQSPSSYSSTASSSACARQHFNQMYIVLTCSNRETQVAHVSPVYISCQLHIMWCDMLLLLYGTLHFISFHSQRLSSWSVLAQWGSSGSVHWFYCCLA